MEPSDIPDPNATVLYVGNLDRRVTDQMMLNILRTGLPHISDKVITANMFAADPNMGVDGYCFVQFSDNNSACQAMTFLNGREFCGKKVKVNWATNSMNGGPPKLIGTSVTIFVGDLDDDINDGELRKAFDPFGEILNAKVVRDPVTNKSKNYGFISFNNKPDAEKAIREMHGAMLKRRPIKTNWATRNQSSKPGSFVSSKNSKFSQLDYEQVLKESNPDNCTVYVTNLPDRITDDILIKHFEPFGKIAGTPRLFEGKNFAFIRFDSHSAAANAIVESNGSELNGAVLKCWWGKDNDSSLSGGSSSMGNMSSYSAQAPNNFNGYNNGAPQENMMQNGQQMTPQQYMLYMQQYAPYYQQQYYQYWMQQYQLMQQQGGGAVSGYAGYQYNPQWQQQSGQQQGAAAGSQVQQPGQQGYQSPQQQY